MKNNKLMLICIICVVFFVIPIIQIIKFLQQEINPIWITLQFIVIAMGIYLLTKKTDNLQNNIKKSTNILKKYRLSSKTYVNMSYFIIFSLLILKCSEYVVVNKITLIAPLAFALPFLILLIIPIGFLYYTIKLCIEIYKISKNKNPEHTNKYLWLSDIIYIAVFIYYTIIIQCKLVQ